MKITDPDFKPRLRYVDAVSVESPQGPAVILHDPRRLAAGQVTVNPVTLFVISHFDGQRTLPQISEALRAQFGQPAPLDQLLGLVESLSEARLLDDETFQTYYQSLVDDYRASPVRAMLGAEELGLDGNAAAVLREVIDHDPVRRPGPGRIAGIIAPHLDYDRGKPCYSAAYAMLADRPAPQRVVILGTNHFGNGTSIVATGKDFSTPLGVTRTDLPFIEHLESRLGDLRADEFDHQREHSVELQLLLCQQLWGAGPGSFRMAAFLCPDPCGPTGLDPIDGCGVNLRDFAESLGDAIRSDREDTLVIAGADLSHVGQHFGDEDLLEDGFLDAVRRRDEAALALVAANDPAAFIAAVADGENPTRVCSAGCISATLFALSEADVSVLRYHQAVDESKTVGVTCAAAALMIE